eukprot:363984-Chlamydomonas_euryale.AAC.7
MDGLCARLVAAVPPVSARLANGGDNDEMDADVMGVVGCIASAVDAADGTWACAQHVRPCVRTNSQQSTASAFVSEPAWHRRLLPVCHPCMSLQMMSARKREDLQFQSRISSSHGGKPHRRIQHTKSRVGVD